MKELSIAMYFIVFLFLLFVEYTGESSIVFASYYGFVFLNLGNAIRMMNKHKKQSE